MTTCDPVPCLELLRHPSSVIRFGQLPGIQSQDACLTCLFGNIRNMSSLHPEIDVVVAAAFRYVCRNAGPLGVCKCKVLGHAVHCCQRFRVPCPHLSHAHMCAQQWCPFHATRFRIWRCLSRGRRTRTNNPTPHRLRPGEVLWHRLLPCPKPIALVRSLGSGHGHLNSLCQTKTLSSRRSSIKVHRSLVKSG